MSEEKAGENLPAVSPAPAAAAPAGGAGVPVVVGEEAGKDIAAVGKKNFAAIYIEGQVDKDGRPVVGKDGKPVGGVVAKLSTREAVVLRSFLKSHNYDVTAKEAGISKASVQRMLRRPNIKVYLEALIRKAAIMEGVDLAWAVKEWVAVWEGVKKPDAGQLMAMREISKIVQPKAERGGPMVQVQVNSFAAGMDDKVVEAELADARESAGETE